VKAAIRSDLQSPDDNPHGYVASAVGTAICAILLAPATVVFHQCLRKEDPKLALTGSVGFVVGLASAVAIGALAPVTHGYTSLHIQLASAAFIGLSAGTWLHLLAARAAPSLLFFQFGALSIVVFLCYGPVEFKNDRLLTGLAFIQPRPPQARPGDSRAMVENMVRVEANHPDRRHSLWDRLCTCNLPSVARPQEQLQN